MSKKRCETCVNSNRYCKTYDCLDNDYSFYKEKEMKLNSEPISWLNYYKKRLNLKEEIEEMEEESREITTMRLMAWEEAQGKMRAMLQTIQDLDYYEETEELVSEFIEEMDELLFDV